MRSKNVNNESLFFFLEKISQNRRVLDVDSDHEFDFEINLLELGNCIYYMTVMITSGSEMVVI